MLIISDLHIGVQRSGGTTPQSQQALRDYLRSGLESLLAKEHKWVIVNGDLFDNFTVDTAEVIFTCQIFYRWLDSHPYSGLTLIAGNHDWSPRGNSVSSFHLLAAMLGLSNVADQVHSISHHNGYTEVYGNKVWAIPHMPNQDLFNAEIEKAVAVQAEGKYLLLHCNYKNTFAEHSDHSLNLSDEQVGALMVSGWSLIIGHEHIGYNLRGGRVLVVGNQFPSSVSDCLGNKEKCAVRLRDSGLEMVNTWSRDGHYLEVDWRQIEGAGADFIRVTGEATSLEAAEVIKAISTLRQTSDAFVISSNVKILGPNSLETAAISLEDLKNFDILAEICGYCSTKEQEVIRDLASV